MQPFISIHDDTKTIILGLIKACEKIDLGNVSFEAYPANEAQITFALVDHEDMWRLVVAQNQEKNSGKCINCRDIYNISGSDFSHYYSERD